MKPTIPPMHNIGHVENYVPHDDLDAPIDYYRDKNHRDSREIFTWVVAAGIMLCLVALVKGCL